MLYCIYFGPTLNSPLWIIDRLSHEKFVFFSYCCSDRVSVVTKRYIWRRYAMERTPIVRFLNEFTYEKWYARKISSDSTSKIPLLWLWRYDLCSCDYALRMFEVYEKRVSYGERFPDVWRLERDSWHPVRSLMGQLRVQSVCVRSCLSRVLLRTTGWWMCGCFVAMFDNYVHFYFYRLAPLTGEDLFSFVWVDIRLYMWVCGTCHAHALRVGIGDSCLLMESLSQYRTNMIRIGNFDVCLRYVVVEITLRIKNSNLTGWDSGHDFRVIMMMHVTCLLVGVFFCTWLCICLWREGIDAVIGILEGIVSHCALTHWQSVERSKRK